MGDQELTPLDDQLPDVSLNPLVGSLIGADLVD